MDMYMDNEDIVIVGAGIAGLTTALALHRVGIKSLVLESSESLRASGYAFTTWNNAWKALDAIGIAHSLRIQHPIIHGVVATSTGQSNSKTSFTFTDDNKSEEVEVRCVKRQLLLETLARELPHDTIKYSSRVGSIEESGHFKRLYLDDGTIIKTKVLIGCDGVNSIIANWLGFKNPAYSGRAAIRGFAKFKQNHGFASMFMQFFGDGYRSGFLPCDDTTVYWFFTWTPNPYKKLEEDPMKMKEFVLSKLENEVYQKMKEVVEMTQVENIIDSHLRYRHPWELLWGNISKGNTCVAGDALHPMTPDLGQGGCSALEDGVILARCLAETFNRKGSVDEEYKRIEIGLKKYAQSRRWRSFDLVTTAYFIGFIQQSNTKLLQFLRDRILGKFLAGLLLKKAHYDCGKLITIS
ncbi:FAD/NAD(P)-binding oxidoreductase family protein [Euphorbia peplus]|nr:FAD/NAD(P)-binding oxidoreductase family protein [Euphorbia peplus]